MGGACLKVLRPKTSSISEYTELTNLYESDITNIDESYRSRFYHFHFLRSRFYHFHFLHSRLPVRSPRSTTYHSRDLVHMDKKKENNEYLVLTDTNYLPRYKYHRSLLDWFMEGIPKIPTFQRCHFDDSCIIIGGNLHEEKKKRLFGETTSCEKVAFADLHKAKTAKKYTNVLMVYIFTGDTEAMLSEIIKLHQFQIFENGIILFVITITMLNDEQMKSKLTEEIVKHGVLHVEFVDGNRSAIVSSLTCILEERMSQHLKQIRTKLLKYWSPSSTIRTQILNLLCPTNAIRSSLSEVNAILRRLKQASSYPEPFIEDAEERTDKKEINEILKRFVAGM